jgi:hypothetical protein
LGAEYLVELKTILLVSMLKARSATVFAGWTVLIRCTSDVEALWALAEADVAMLA